MLAVYAVWFPGMDPVQDQHDDLVGAQALEVEVALRVVGDQVQGLLAVGGPQGLDVDVGVFPGQPHVEIEGFLIGGGGVAIALLIRRGKGFPMVFHPFFAGGEQCQQAQAQPLECIHTAFFAR